LHKIGLIDYGMGNIHSVTKSLESLFTSDLFSIISKFLTSLNLSINLSLDIINKIFYALYIN